MPLPGVPIGVGARWRAVRPITDNGLAMTSTTTVEVTSLDATQLGLLIDSEVKGSDQTMTQSGLAMQMSHVAGTAHGKVTIDLAHAVPSGTLHFELHADMTAGDQTTAMSSTVDLMMSAR